MVVFIFLFVSCFRSLEFLSTAIQDAWLLFPKAEIPGSLVEVFLFLTK